MAIESSKCFRMVQDGWFSGDTKILLGEALIARFSFSSWKTQGAILFDGGDYEVVRPKGLGPVLRLQRDGVALCETRIAGMWTQRAELSMDGVEYRVTWPAFDSKTILKCGDIEVGSVGKWRVWVREADAVFHESVPQMVCVFVMWLATRKRLNDAS